MMFDIKDGWAVATAAPLSNGAGGYVNGRGAGVMPSWLIAVGLVAVVLVMRRKKGKA